MNHSSRFAAVAVCLGFMLGAPLAGANGIVLTNGAGTPTTTSPVRLTDHRVTATLTDRVADVVVEQVFHNDLAGDVEGTYLFPLPRGAVVQKFAMTMGGKMVEGEIVEAKKARAIYEDIVSRKKDPGLLEHAGDGVFKARVFPIPGRGDVTVRLTFQEVLQEDAGTLEWRYPLATDRMNGLPVDRVRVDVSIASPVDVKVLYSPTHRVDTVRDGERKARVTYEATGRREARDFLLYVGRSADDVGFSVLSTKPAGEDGTFLAVFAPRAAAVEAARVRKDVVFVLDTSGSMEGDKIRQARAALAHGVRSLREGDRFAVLAFATSVRPWREALVEATPATTEEAARWIESLQATGATDIEGALSSALRLLPAERLAFVVFVTDGRPTIGEASADALVAKAARENVAKARIFTFGVGHDLDVNLLDRLADGTKAVHAYVQPGEDIEEATSRFFRKLSQPVLADASIEFPAGAYDVYPPRIGDLFAGDQVTVFGRYRESGTLSFRVRGRAGDKPVETVCAATLRADAGAESLPRLWAHRKVAFLLDEIRLHGRKKELVDEVVRLATRHSIVTPYTSGLVVEEPRGREVAAGVPVIRDAVTADHSDSDEDMPSEESFGEGGLSDTPFEGPSRNRDIGIGGGSGGAFQGRGGHRNLRAGGGGGRRSDDGAEGALRWLQAHQSPDGGWESAGFGNWCDGKPAARAGSTDAGEAGYDVATTGLSLLAYLGAGYTHRDPSPFGLVVTKGLRWLKGVQDAEGCFGPRSSPHFLTDHAIATLALVEAYGMTGSALYRGPAQKGLDFLALSQRAFLGPNVQPAGGDGVYLSGWAMLAIRSAKLVAANDVRTGRPPSLVVDEDSYRALLAQVAAGTDPATVGLSMLARVFSGENPRTSPSFGKAAALLAQRLPAWDPPAGSIDLRAWHFGTLAAFQTGGDVWKRWDAAMKTAIIDTQRTDGDPCAHKGSWDPVDPKSRGGRVESTALLSLCLEVYYRYDKGPAGTEVSPAAAPQTDADRVRESEELRRRREASSEGELPPR